MPEESKMPTQGQTHTPKKTQTTVRCGRRAMQHHAIVGKREEKPNPNNTLIHPYIRWLLYILRCKGEKVLTISMMRWPHTKHFSAVCWKPEYCGWKWSQELFFSSKKKLWWQTDRIKCNDEHKVDMWLVIYRGCCRALRINTKVIIWMFCLSAAVF